MTAKSRSSREAVAKQSRSKVAISLKVEQSAGHRYRGGVRPSLVQREFVMSTDTAGKSRSRLPLMLLLLLLVIVAAGGWMWQSGIFQPRAKLAMVTAGSTGTYWELIEHGTKDAADRYNVNLTVIHPTRPMNRHRPPPSRR